MKRVILGFSSLVIILIIAIVFSFFSSEIDMDRSFSHPSLIAPFGYDSLGRNLLLEVSSGVVISLLLAISVTAISIILGVTISYLMGMNRIFFSILNVICTSFKILPTIALALFLASIGGPSVLKLLIALSISMISNVARTLSPRMEVIKKEPYMKISEGFGISGLRLFIKHGLKALLPYIREESLSIMVSTIVLEASLSYLGCGVGVSTQTLGRILADSRPYFFLYPRLVLVPATTLVLITLSLSFISSGLREMSKLYSSS